jgi:predicted  nucleic acid-binding Zn-ribbon protein
VLHLLRVIFGSELKRLKDELSSAKHRLNTLEFRLTEAQALNNKLAHERSALKDKLKQYESKPRCRCHVN